MPDAYSIAQNGHFLNLASSNLVGWQNTGFYQTCLQATGMVQALLSKNLITKFTKVSKFKDIVVGIF